MTDQLVDGLLDEMCGKCQKMAAEMFNFSPKMSGNLRQTSINISTLLISVKFEGNR